MNKLVLKKDQLLSTFSPDSSLHQIFNQIEKDLIQKQEIVCRFLVNGLALTEDDEKKFAGFLLSEVDLIEVESENPDVLLVEVINNWVSGLPAMISKSDELANTIRLHGIENHLGAFVSLVDSCQFLVQSLISLRTLCASVDLVRSEAWQKSEDMTARAIAEALMVFEKKDFVLLADIMEYDLGHCLQNWLESLRELKTYVCPKTPDPVGP